MDFDFKDLQAMFSELAEKFEQERDRLCEIDGHIGDADHGLAMCDGMKAASQAVGNLAPGSTVQAKRPAPDNPFLEMTSGKS